MRRFIVFLCIMGITQLMQSQLAIQPDCDSIPFLPFSTYIRMGTKGDLKDHGMIMEIKAPTSSNMFFEEEHHTSWYKFKIPVTGELVLNVKPYKKADDIDFILFKYNESDFQQQLLSHKIKPVRSNLARGDSTILGITGLSDQGKTEFTGRGPGNSFGTPLKVTKGEIYYIVIDNVHSTNGFSLEMGIQNEVNIEGVTVDENEAPVQAHITITNQNGETVKETETEADGSYSLKIKLWEKTSNLLTTESDKHFFYSMEINTANNKDKSFTSIRSVMFKLKKGTSYQIGELNFYGDSPQLVFNSRGSLEALYKLLNKNPKMKIRIEGHVNDVNHIEPESYCKNLSENRCKTVYNFLVEKGITKDRLEILGLSCKFPLFPRPQNEAQQRRNRRVEINVLEY